MAERFFPGSLPKEVFLIVSKSCSNRYAVPPAYLECSPEKIFATKKLGSHTEICANFANTEFGK